MELNPSKFELVEKAIQIMQAMPAEIKIDSAITETALEKIRQLQPAAQQPKKRSLVVIMRYAAAVAAVSLIAFWAIRQYDLKNPEQVWQTAYGQIDTIQLADGSEVVLNANSRLRGRELKKGSGDRELWLDGEAFFNIKSTGNGQRMLVHTNAGDVVVTGTQFNVHNRSSQVSVLLTEGSVSIQNKNGKSWPLKPGEMARFEPGSDVDITPGNLMKVLAWKKSMIVLDKTPASELALLIREHYGKNVHLKGDTTNINHTLSGLMPNNRLDDLLRAVTMVTNWKIEANQDSVLIVVN